MLQTVCHSGSGIGDWDVQDRLPGLRLIRDLAAAHELEYIYVNVYDTYTAKVLAQAFHHTVHHTLQISYDDSDDSDETDPKEYPYGGSDYWCRIYTRNNLASELAGYNNEDIFHHIPPGFCSDGDSFEQQINTFIEM